MKMENDDQAYNTLRNSLGSLENKMREIYNLGFKAGVEEGKNRMLDDILEHFTKMQEGKNEQ